MTRRAPKAAESSSPLPMPFWSVSTVVSGPTAGMIVSIATLLW